MNKYITRIQRNRPSLTTDSQGGRLGESIDYGEPASQQVAGSKGKNNRKPEECEVCGKIFKGARGVRIHQGKSGCKSARGQNRIVKSKPVVEDFRETHHSDFFCSNKPETAAMTSSTNGLNTCSEKATNSIELEMTLSQDITYRLKEIRKAPEREPEMTLSQDIACKLKEIRKESDVLIIVDETEEDIQNSIREEEAAQHANRNMKRRRTECDDKVLIIENAIEREIREQRCPPAPKEAAIPRYRY